ncbi:MAG: hypothetical protein OJJ21_19750 [Ferrovibrio sp.]|uniref:hypothetical protein n=1 Tax=Ferrovibrio sp. TaxID=1917215 RepID=UPI00260F0ABA|nr:hypothetical protein [Ferrovibrio sp.]MCW0235842.1 hypothetical protein [Ferrovibrio sp.]
MQFPKITPAQPGTWRIVLVGLTAAAVAVFAIADNDRVSAVLAGAALLGSGLLLVLPLRKPAQ